ncbi:MAG: DUF1467 family protein [Rhodospirillales bacterium]
MTLTGSIAIYIIIWWLVLFMVLPFGAGRKIDAESVSEGHDAGAPAKPMMWRKLLATTLISFVVFGFFYWAEAAGMLDFRAGG